MELAVGVQQLCDYSGVDLLGFPDSRYLKDIEFFHLIFTKKVIRQAFYCILVVPGIWGLCQMGQLGNDFAVKGEVPVKKEAD